MGWGGEREIVLGRGSDADGQGFPHTPNILTHTHLSLYIVYLLVCVFAEGAC